MFEDLFYGLAKGTVVFFLVFVAYLINLLILQPLKFRKKFSKYSNVYISEKFNPLVGDMNHEVQCVNEGKVHYAHYAKRAHILAKYDLQAKLEGIEPVIMIISDKACKQFCSFMPRSIDRINAEKGINVLLQHSLIVDRSDKRTMARRKNFSSWIGLNSASKYIPRTVGFCQDMLEAMTTEGKTDLLKHLNKLTFDVFTKILFGNDVDTLVARLYPYENPDGQIEEIGLGEYVIRLAARYADQLYNPVTFIFPFFAKRKLMNPYKRDNRNLQTFRAALRNIISTSKDENTIGKKFYYSPGLSEDEGLDDLFLVMGAGSETTAHSMASCLYYLNKYPECHEKLIKDLTRCGFTKGCDYEKQYNLDNIQECSYLNYVVKETFRMDSVVPGGSEYGASEDIEICGVPIPKGTKVKLDLISNHFSDDKWLEPFEFVPERHDIESDFYERSRKAGKVEDAYSRRAFSHGQRNCPGQSFANMQLKVVMAFLVSHMSFKFDKEDLEKDGIGFGLGSQFKPQVNVSKI